MQKRYIELDSLRGIAALTVLLSHLNLATGLMQNEKQIIKVIDSSPLHLIYAGHEAVIFFFVLSGFVLTLPYTKSQNIVYTDFIIKRVIRLYLPVFSALLFSYLAYLLVEKVPQENVNPWIYSMWSSEVTLVDIVNNIFLIGFYEYKELNPVIWSLIHEMRISLIFPFILIIIFRVNWKFSFFIAIVISYFGVMLHNKLGVLDINIANISFGKTMHYTAMFILGAVVASKIDLIIGFIKNNHPIFKLFIFIAACLSYTYTFWFFRDSYKYHSLLINDWFTVLGALLFIVLALSSEVFSKVLINKFLIFVGKISFSFYIFHLICMSIFFNSFSGILPVYLIVFLSIVSSFIVSTINHYYIENYSIFLGRRLVEKRALKRNK